MTPLSKKDFWNFLQSLKHFFSNHLKGDKSERNQDGGVGRHTEPPRTTRTENRTARGTDTKEIENKHSSRLVGGGGDGHRGGEDSSGCGGTETGGVWDKWHRQSQR